jgi:sensor histidine kinase YesM
MKLALQVLVDCLAVALVVAVLAVFWSGQLRSDELAALLAEAWIYTVLIATPAHWLLPRLHAFVVERRPSVQWAFLVAVLVLLSIAGSVVGSGIVLALNLEPGATFAAILSASVKLSLLLAVLIGVAHAMLILLRERVDAAEVRLRTQETKYERALKLATEARLAALEARIHPHFLFNALNTVSSLIPTAPARAEQLLQRLSALLRFSLDVHQGGLVSLQQELKIVRDYLEIEQARFGPRLRFAIEANDELADRQIPALSVQTLVENSVKHVVGSRRDGAEIRIQALAEGDSLRIEVADTGPGFSLAELPAGHGLDNLRSRLAALFGDADALRVADRDGWTVVGFRLPA